ncbi:MAG: sugar ABC transporter ATP-binding protein [Cyclobacteriaceae bacterium]|nr:sugar ABC transporter ATP-binding protein [Cyclobacteriaceae bacterium HetDA_MAG_MS6]
MPENSYPLLQLSSISKYFPGVKALDKVDLELRTGEVHAICGENGAGKSTLMKILTGVYTPDEGQVFIEGKDTKLTDYSSAIRQGIAIVHQEKSLCSNMTLAENIFTKPPTNRFGLIDYRQLTSRSERILERVGLARFSPNTKLHQLSAGEQQMIELGKAIASQPKILILDEPTASVTDTEVNIIFDLIDELRSKGTSVFYISHRMAEIFHVSDRISVLKDGQYQGTVNTFEVDVDMIIKMMVGRELLTPDLTRTWIDEQLFEIKDFCGDHFSDIDLSIKKGEIVGLSGLVGAGRTELAKTIMGALPKHTGIAKLMGKEVVVDHPAEAWRYGIGYLPEDRKHEGLFLEMSVRDNMLTARHQYVGNDLTVENIKSVCLDMVDKLNITPGDISRKVVNLSGGNQQKVLISRCLLTQPKLLIVDEPTHGVDIGAKSEIYEILRSLTKEGVGILLISSELPEVIALCDRIYVMCQGQLTAELKKNEDDYSEENILSYASGTKNMFNHSETPV